MTDGREHGGEERDDDVVAAEYVLGVLPAGERIDVVRRVDVDRAFAARVAAWEERLAGMNDEFGEAPPPAAAWRNVEARLFGAETAPIRDARAGLWSSLAFWRGMAAAALLLVAVMAAVVMRETPAVAPQPELVASLTAPDSDAAFVALRQADGNLRVTSVGAGPGQGNDHELWVIAGDAPPVSLGIVPADAPHAAALPAQLAELDPSSLTFAVSREPAGGSPTGAPTGPVVAAGTLKKI